jgi:hypothetical protein
MSASETQINRTFPIRTSKIIISLILLTFDFNITFKNGNANGRNGKLVAACTLP